MPVALRTCPLCEATCGLAISLDGDRVTGVRGDPDDVRSHGFICPKGAVLGDLHHDPDRLRAPRVRRDGALTPCSWDEAFAAVESGLRPILRDHGRDAVAVYLGNPNVHTLAGQLYIKPLLRALRTKNLYSASTLDQMPKHVACGLMFGHPDAIPVPDVDRTDLLIVLGANPLASNGSLCTAPDFPGRLRALRARGGRLVVIDPRRTRTAAIADLHLPIRPGTDALLLLALLEALFATGRADLRHLAPHTDGLDALAAAAARFPAERVAPRVGLPAPALRALAADLADAPSASVYGRLGTCTQAFGTLTSWLIDAVNVATGHLDRPGGAMFPLPFHTPPRPGRPPGGPGFTLGRWTSRVHGHPEARRELPTATLPDEILTPGPGAVRALICVAGNPALSAPGAARFDAALAALDFFVAVDPYLNETTRHADVILPPPSPLERAHCDLAFAGLSVRNAVHYSPPALPLPDTARSEEEILARLVAVASGHPVTTPPEVVDGLILSALAHAEVADDHSPLRGRAPRDLIAALPPRPGPERVLDFLIRAGAYGDHFGATPAGPPGPGLTLDAVLDAPHGVDLGPLRPRLPELLRTPSGRIALDPAPLAAELDRLEATLAEPAPPLVLIGRRHLRSNNSWLHNVERLVRGRPRCTLEVHPEDAARRGLVDGAPARLTSRAGALIVDVEVTDAVAPGVVSLPHGWGHGQPGAELAVAACYPGVNANRVVDPEALDPLSGNAVQNGVPVDLAPVDPAAADVSAAGPSEAQASAR